MCAACAGAAEHGVREVGAYLLNTFGSKHLVAAVLQCRRSMVPSGAEEHVRGFTDEEEHAETCLDEVCTLVEMLVLQSTAGSPLAKSARGRSVGCRSAAM